MKALSLIDYRLVSEQEGIGVAELRTIKQVESNGNGHLADGRPKILFEGHKFYLHLSKLPEVRKKAAKERPDLCFPKWSRAHYKGGVAEWDRLDAAIKYNREAALKSASWGAFQIMGEHYAVCGFSTVQEFVNSMFKEERYHLEAVCNFIKANPKMYRALLAHDWATFARLYNGAGYKANKYDEKLAAAFAKFSKE
ncbi:N-acetylmuramidase family protein [Rufibacter quisquiliarum]|uniref:N-acetylmuramidase domain-containing protein n=1 Tax=Rufibacter quisquiliarum TaxID=1549639 RepID=A0A839GKN1_9BACT|nr:N-acetylmuramidase family protein [Rufibacter quisquiliarum]MBA9078343.1 hypothetical protein [Rufibacter quisquiliarum]